MVFAKNWTSEVSISTPAWGGTKYNTTIYDAKDTNSVQGSTYATYQKTGLHHGMALTYQNASGSYIIGSEWADMDVDVIRRPELKLVQVNNYYYSVAKSNNLEPTSNTVVKFKYSADYM